ncbi:MAG TPA: hypothetical protein PK432_02190 [Candidatus Dojkabacteria bacterium]|jgi:hypothetical protein|nr:hypothetical protein [Candidatus Dojkabacteria bacterium]
MIKVNDMWVCAHCHNVFNGDDEKEEAGYCSACAKKHENVHTNSQSKNWIKYIKELRDREWNYRQQTCSMHNFQKIPKSGMYLGTPLWRCIYCEAVVQAS